jgi:hypothetical protein
MEKIQFTMTKSKETKGTCVCEVDVADAGKPPVLKTQYVQKWVFGSNPPARIEVTIEPA